MIQDLEILSLGDLSLLTEQGFSEYHGFHLLTANTNEMVMVFVLADFVSLFTSPHRYLANHPFTF